MRSYIKEKTYRLDKESIQAICCSFERIIDKKIKELEKTLLSQLQRRKTYRCMGPG